MFKELVPNGYGRMVMKTTADKTRELGEEGEEGGKRGELVIIASSAYLSSFLCVCSLVVDVVGSSSSSSSSGSSSPVFFL